MSKFQLKTGDVVIVTTGKDKGKQGKILQAFPKMNRVVVEGVRITKRHLKTRKQGDKGQVVEISMPIHASNVMPVGPKGKAIRHNKANAAK
jgi:large subunit ribosomal protein L24